MTWIILAGLTALFESCKDAVSKRSLLYADRYVVSWALFALMVPVLAGYWLLGFIPPLGPQFGFALMVGGTLNTIAMVLYVKALECADLSLTVPVVTLTPLFLLITSPWLVQEYPSGVDVVGVLLIVVGAYVLNLKEKRKGYLAPLRALFYQSGPRLMLMVAFIWSITSNFDKIGVLNSSPSFWVIALFSFIAIALLPMMVVKSHQPVQQLRSHFPILLLAGVLSSVTVLVQMQAIQMALVTRVIAIKRLSALFSVLWGYWFFKEVEIRDRLMGATFMVIGVFCMVLF
jgi:drug/metabolite transporter (DMT)-like permease